MSSASAWLNRRKDWMVRSKSAATRPNASGAANVRVGQDSNTKEKSKTTRFVTISVSASFNF